MSPTFANDESLRKFYFRNVNGNKLRLIDETTNSKNVMKFILYQDLHMNIIGIVPYMLTSLILWNTFDTLVPFILSVVIFLFRLFSFLTCVNKDILTVVKSVGIYNEQRHIFNGFNSCEFIPWDTAIDICINEVITGGVILSYYNSERNNLCKGHNQISSTISKFSTRTKMSGIYLQKASCINGAQEKENSSLSVPGSYWLRHKAQLYKFIFRYHQTNRNIKEFQYARELIKIIRRVIKSRPPPQQQFATSHLLVTFSQSVWSRHDKMFAMLQVAKQTVSMCSHAYVLTIEVVHPVETEENRRCTITSSTIESSISQNGHSYPKHNNDIVIPKESRKCTIPSQEYDFTKKCNIEKIDLQSKNISIQEENVHQRKRGRECMNQDEQDKNSNRNRGNSINVNVFCKLSTASKNVDLSNEVLVGDHCCLNSIRPKDKKSRSENFHVKNTESINDGINTEEQNIRNNSVECKDSCSMIDNKFLNNFDTLNDMHEDFSKLSHKYFVKKGVRNTECDMEKHCSKQVGKSNPTKDSNINSDSIKPHTSLYAKKRKHESDSTIVRSSDITDLVMEGWMLTILQSKDAVAVIEQKTESKADEVLENSEQIETNKGEKRLQNSSLLGLENLITMIESRDSSYEDRRQNEMMKSPTIKNQSISKFLLNNIQYSFPNDRTNEMNNEIEFKRLQEDSCESSLVTDANFVKDIHNSVDVKSYYSSMYNDSKYEKYKNPLKMECTEYKEECQEEERRPVSELLPKKEHQFQSSIYSNKKQFKEELQLLPSNSSITDYMNNEISSKTTKTKGCSIVNQLPADCVTKKRKPTVPVVISNQVITLSEMPLRLQKMLIDKASIKRVLEKDRVINPQSGPPVCNGILTNEQCLRYQAQVSNSKEINIESVSHEAPKNELRNTDTVDKNVNLKEEDLKGPNNSIEVDEKSSNKLKDITQQFYEDLSYLQSKESARNKQYLDKRGKPNVHKERDNEEIHLQMVKLFQDIVGGARVVLRRITL